MKFLIVKIDATFVWCCNSRKATNQGSFCRLIRLVISIDFLTI